MSIRENATRENAIETNAYLDDNKLLNEPVLPVTAAIYMPRAMKTFETIGINVIPGTTDISASGTLVSGFIIQALSFRFYNSRLYKLASVFGCAQSFYQT